MRKTNTDLLSLIKLKTLFQFSLRTHYASPFDCKGITIILHFQIILQFFIDFFVLHTPLSIDYPYLNACSP